MPGEVVTGPPMSGKSEFARQEIARRESAGELGLVLLGFSELYRALVPGEQSQFRDEAVSDTGAPRMVGYAFEVVAAAMVDRELSGYVVTQSPRQAIRLADRFDGPLFEVVADVGDVAIRVDAHMTKLARDVARAKAENALVGCRQQAVAYQREREALAGRAVEVKRKGRGFQKGGTVRQFDRALYERGLSPRGRAALDELKSLGNAEPSPADVQAFLLKNRVDT
ncbi:MAG: hypothetical protein OXG35_27465 [Acidobacteria bacterium]|nr:hypothetical protein [Acidobacteriota bacterium]